MAVRQPLQTELSKVDEEIEAIDVQINDLRKRRRELETRKDNVLGQIKVSQQRDQSADWESTVFPWSKAVDAVLKKMSIESFRHLQLSTMNATLGKKDCILIMPTGKNSGNVKHLLYGKMQQ